MGDFSLALAAYFDNKQGSFGPYVVTNNQLIYRTFIKSEGYRQDVLCVRKNDVYIGNSSTLDLVGTTYNKGIRSTNRTYTIEQTTLIRLNIAMFPFKKLKELKLQLSDLELIGKTEDNHIFNNAGNRFVQKIIKHYTGLQLVR